MHDVSDVAATRRAITNTSGGNRAAAMAGLLAADYNAQTKLGELFRQAEEVAIASIGSTSDRDVATPAPVHRGSDRSG